MSGTSLDGLDIACVRFSYDSCWQYEVICCESVEYDLPWKDQLKKAMQLSGLELKKLDLAFGDWLGSAANSFIGKYAISPELIVSHGHTIFHQPEIGLTMQIGDGYRIFTATGIKTVLICGLWMWLLAVRGLLSCPLAINCFLAIMIIA